MRKGATEEELLELIGKAVSNKHAKHAGIKFEPIDDAARLIFGNICKLMSFCP